MSYQVLARKWRPRTFHEMVGQVHVVRALVNALDNDRLHHAYLFTGTRGVGKTTVARILAKSLNCEKGVSSKPCGECSACTEVDEGRFVDLIEVDAASRTKVDETRDLLDNVQYAPTRGRYKVYLIDEVHMFSNHSFNALLKTLEEPPPHVKFLLATTDPQKLPMTILSRCLQFNLKRLPIADIAGYLEQVLEAEGVEFEPDALRELARAADGSMRDALSLLDQAISHGGGKVASEEVRAMLGTIERGQVYAILQALAVGDGAGLLAIVAELAGRAPDFDAVLAELLSVLQRVAVAQTVPEALDDELGDEEQIRALAAAMPPEDVQLFYQIGLMGRRDLGLAPDPRAGLEMTLLRMLAFRPAGGVARPAPVQSATPAAAPATGAPGGEAEAATLSRPAAVGDWSGMIEAMGLKGMLRQLAENCTLVRQDDTRIELALEPVHASLRNDKLVQRLQQSLAKLLGGDVKLVLEVGASETETPARHQARLAAERRARARQAIEEDVNVKALQETFGARVVEDTIEPLNE